MGRKQSALGRRVTLALKARRWSQADLSREVGCSRTTICRMVLGQMVPVEEKLREIARVLEIPEAEMFALASEGYGEGSLRGELMAARAENARLRAENAGLREYGVQNLEVEL